MYDSEPLVLSATKSITLKLKSKELARKVAKNAEAVAVQPPEGEHNIEAIDEPVALAKPALEVATSSGPSNETQSQSEPLCKLFEPPQLPDTRRISSQTTKDSVHFVIAIRTTVYISCLFCVASTQ